MTQPRESFSLFLSYYYIISVFFFGYPHHMLLSKWYRSNSVGGPPYHSPSPPCVLYSSAAVGYFGLMFLYYIRYDYYIWIIIEKYLGKKALSTRLYVGKCHISYTLYSLRSFISVSKIFVELL
jgi:hypothetical protein